MKGTYTLLIHLPRRNAIRVGKLEKIDFDEGFYAYVGSGLRNLERRIERHLKDKKNAHWHIDYLLDKAIIREIIYANEGRRRECDIAERIGTFFKYVPDFGSSDCSCRSHLFYSQKKKRMVERIISSFKDSGIEPKRWFDGKRMAEKEKK